jgi:hypothetical protein
MSKIEVSNRWFADSKEDFADLGFALLFLPEILSPLQLAGVPAKV